MSKYQPLRDHLSATKGDRLDISFDRIETILKTPLPASARKYPAWWANQDPIGRPQTAAWQMVGWRSSNVNLSAQRITFIRSETGPTDHPGNESKTAEISWPDIGSDIEPIDKSIIVVEFAWRFLGTVSIDHRDRLRFPRTPFGPVVYRFDIFERTNIGIYVGETEELSRRFQHYRTPGITQKTNQRLNEIMKSCLENGGTVKVYVMHEPAFEISAEGASSILDLKHHRRLLELAAIAHFEKCNVHLFNL